MTIAQLITQLEAEPDHTQEVLLIVASISDGCNMLAPIDVYKAIGEVGLHGPDGWCDAVDGDQNVILGSTKYLC